ncbi:hypothetical protein CA14_007780 [Aspergillus flavus]|uniref:EKC/KEOPS complex subunit BUD32 n=1 Tax=Aspergillus flavus TaxID=5059 RepID=A0AB74BVU2_ASPFL|nr:hypothetical protein CA14_007780 [Aspergillus flavus]
MVAKIYDPLYHDFSFNDEDPFLGVDYDYTHECAAYMHLSNLQGSVIPRFFGSYTLTIDLGENSRHVRLILIEHIDGLSMDRLNPEMFPREERQEIMKQIINGESSLYTKYVLHEDLCPRNIIIQRNTTLGERQYLPGVAISPLLRWNVVYRRQAYFHDWIDWPWQAWLEAQYKDTEATITAEQREIWAIEDRMLEAKGPPPIE